MHEPREARVVETNPSDAALGASNMFLGRLKIGRVGLADRFWASARSTMTPSGRFEAFDPASTLT